jgi:hypothetical protein
VPYAARVPAQVLQKLRRHASIKTTMDFYANVDDAVREAILGPKTPKRNDSRNTRPDETPSDRDKNDATPVRSELSDE